MSSARSLLLLFVACALGSGSARADTPDAPAPKPWAVGVSDAEQTVALELYEQGNHEFQAARFAPALAKYGEAIKHWDHPAIHFNMAVCLINLDQPLEAKDHLDRALAFGEDALGADMYAQGLTYQHSLDGQIARVRIACKEPEATITLDGAFVFTGPGEMDRNVMPGRHQIVATKPGFLTASETVELAPSKLTKYDVRLVAFKPATRLARRWTVWKPYAVLAGGGAGVALGALGYLLASHDFAGYDAGITSACPHGCDAAMAAALSDLNGRKHRGEIEQGVAASLFVVGGAAIVTGVIGIVLNQPRSVVEHATLTPTVALTHGAVMLTWGGGW